MFDVNIYIETSARGPKSRRAAGMYVLECIKEGRVAGTKDGFIYMDMAAENALVLALLQQAFSRLTKACSVRVNTQCSYVLGTINNYWIIQWRKNGWLNAKGKSVANREAWEVLSGQMADHLVSADQGWHGYRELMQYTINRELQAGYEGNMVIKRDILRGKES